VKPSAGVNEGNASKTLPIWQNAIEAKSRDMLFKAEEMHCWGWTWVEVRAARWSWWLRPAVFLDPSCGATAVPRRTSTNGLRELGFIIGLRTTKRRGTGATRLFIAI
jgi:hypothetical protein